VSNELLKQSVCYLLCIVPFQDAISNKPEALRGFGFIAPFKKSLSNCTSFQVLSFKSGLWVVFCFLKLGFKKSAVFCFADTKMYMKTRQVKPLCNELQKMAAELMCLNSRLYKRYVLYYLSVTNL
jgi:hypothetical protein